MVRGLDWGSIFGLFLGLVLELFLRLYFGLPEGMFIGMFYLLLGGLAWGLFLGIGWGLVDTRPELIAYRTPTEARSRSLLTALILGLVTAVLVSVPFVAVFAGPSPGPLSGFFGLFVGMNNGGRFVVLQKAAERRLARAGKLPARSDDFLEWGIENQIFRRIGGGVRFRHDFIQQHLANTSEGVS